MSWLLVASALAGLREDLFHVTRDEPEVAFACTNGTIARATLARIAPLMPEGEQDATLAAFDGLTRVADTSGVAMAVWGGGERARFVVADSAAETVAARLAIQLGGAMTSEGGRLRVGALEVQPRDRWVDIHDGWVADPSGVPLPTDMVVRLPDGPGCLVWAHEQNEKFGLMQMLVHLSADPEQGAVLAVRGGKLSEADLGSLPNAVPLAVRTRAVPSAVVVLGVSAAALESGGLLTGEKGRAALAALRAFPLGPGLTLAIFDGSPIPEMALIAPMERDLRAGVLARRTRRLLRKADIPFERINRTHLAVALPGMAIGFSFARGGIVVSNSAEILAEIEAMEGTPWFGESEAALVSSWPIVMMASRIPGDPPTVLARPMQIGLRVVEGDLYGQLVVPIPPEQLREMMDRIKRDKADPAAPTP